PPATATHFAALHRQLDLVAAWKAPDDAELGAQNAIHDPGKLIVISAGAGRTNDELLVENLIELGDAALTPRRADGNLVIGAAEPVEFCRLNDPTGLAQQGIERDTTRECADGGPVLRRDLVEPICQRLASRTGHVARNKVRISGEMPAHETRQQAC